MVELTNDFLEVHKCSTLIERILKLRELVEFENCAIACLYGRSLGRLRSFDGMNVSFPLAFAEQYIMKRLPWADPAVLHHIKNYGLSYWKDFAPKGEMAELFGDFKVREAYLHGLPSRTPGAREGSFFTISGRSLPRTRRTDFILNAMMPHMHQALLRTLKDSPLKNCPLSGREIEVLKWISMGKSAWDISVILGISERTVNFHASNIIRKLDAANRRHAVAIAMEQGILTLG